MHRLCARGFCLASCYANVLLKALTCSPVLVCRCISCSLMYCYLGCICFISAILNNGEVNNFCMQTPVRTLIERCHGFNEMDLLKRVMTVCHSTKETRGNMEEWMSLCNTMVLNMI